MQRKPRDAAEVYSVMIFPKVGQKETGGSICINILLNYLVSTF